jgi:hypothetical protein
VRFAWLILPALWLAWWLRGDHTPPGVLVAEAPVQSSAALPEWQHNGFRIRALAEYRIRGRLLGREHYWMDGGARISPFDLAIGWGPMSDQAVLDRLWFSQGRRFLAFTPSSGGWPIPYDELNSHSANMHIVPANAAVRGAAEWTRIGRIVVLRGYLIEAEGPDLSKWRSSLSRTDSGAGACELMWVNEFERP